MSASVIIFYMLSAIIVAGGILAVTSQKIFRAAVFLLFSLIGVSGLYFYLNYEFLGAVQIVVYVGGIVVLIIFSIFLTADSGKKMKTPGITRMVASALSVVFACLLIVRIISEHQFIQNTETIIDAGVKNIGRQMLSINEHGYILPFEVISILLLSAMIGCIVIAIKSKPEEK
ncbi:MAG: NADH-quinone oxidoreductase subunit J [Bacteroidia bacterium]|nr:NADH-quinone oxidoreductase subunit J [Bacteroidia bacterium]